VFDVRSHGQSRICKNLGHAGADPRQSILAEASVDDEDVICAAVDVAGGHAVSPNGLVTEIPDAPVRTVPEARYGGA
jgi:hypothetical protein